MELILYGQFLVCMHKIALSVLHSSYMHASRMFGDMPRV